MTVAKDSFIQIRVSAEAKAEMLSRAEVEGVSLSELLRRAVLEPAGGGNLGLVRDDKHYGPPPEKPVVPPGGIVERGEVFDAVKPASEVRYKCPHHPCKYRVPSPAARCPEHGRKVVPV